MRGLWVLTRVSEDKRQELVQSLSSFFAEPSVRPYRRFIFQDLNDESLVGWLGYWREGEQLEGFLESPTFHALKGAAETLGHLEEVQRLTLDPLCDRAPRPRTRGRKRDERWNKTSG